jgi:hypothetical protein
MSSYHYASTDIYNMDETGFPLSTSQRLRRVGPVDAPTKSQTALANDVRITVIATISTHDAPVPPYLIYPGGNLLEEWLQLRDPAPNQLARVTDSGYTNNFVQMDWLRSCFDPYTRERAGRSRRLLYMDGHNAHVTIEFIEEAWARNIVCIILPAHMSSIYQPLDVDFFGPLKLRYNTMVSDYQLGSDVSRLPKGVFYRWHQRAWAQTATSHQIRQAWAKTGLFPLNRAIMGALSPSPEPAAITVDPPTPHSSRTLRDISVAVRQRQASPTQAFLKTAKGMEKLLAEKTMLEDELKRRTSSDELHKAARGGNKRTRYPSGFVFNQEYFETQQAEIAERRAAEKKRTDERRVAARKQKGKGRALDTGGAGGPSRTVQDENTPAVMHQDL